MIPSDGGQVMVPVAPFVKSFASKMKFSEELVPVSQVRSVNKYAMGRELAIPKPVVHRAREVAHLTLTAP